MTELLHVPYVSNQQSIKHQREMHVRLTNDSSIERLILTRTV